MTAACPGGGASAPRPGVDSSIQFNGTQVAAALAITGEEDLAAIVAVVTSGTVLATDLFCASDPPTSPTLTDQDFADAKNPLNPAAFTTAVGRIKDWFLHWYWFQICECTGATTPPPPGITLPTGTGTGTSLPTGTTSTPCWDVSTAYALASSSGSGNQNYLDLTSRLVPATTSLASGSAGSNPPMTLQAIPTGVTAVTLTTTVAQLNPTSFPMDNTIAGYDASGNLVRNFCTTGAFTTGSLTQTVTAPIPSGSVYWGVFASCGFTGITTNFVTEVSFLCSGQSPTTLEVPCCPPDPLIQNYLQLILNLVQNLYTAPAGAPSTGWADGNVHAGLSGTGSFQLATNVSGIRANFTTIPPSIRVTPGTPTFYWDLGFVTPVALVTPLRSLRTVFQAQAMALPVQTTAIDYTFPPGVVVTLTELLPA